MMPLLEEILVEILFTFINANIYYTYNDYFLWNMEILEIKIMNVIAIMDTLHFNSKMTHRSLIFFSEEAI